MLDREVLERSSSTLLKVPRDIIHANFRRALVETNGLWPNVKVLLVWADQSMHDCVWAAKSIFDIAAQDRPWGRKIEIERLSGANHFVSSL